MRFTVSSSFSNFSGKAWTGPRSVPLGVACENFIFALAPGTEISECAS